MLVRYNDARGRERMMLKLWCNSLWGPPGPWGRSTFSLWSYRFTDWRLSIQSHFWKSFKCYMTGSRAQVQNAVARYGHCGIALCLYYDYYYYCNCLFYWDPFVQVLRWKLLRHIRVRGGPISSQEFFPSFLDHHVRATQSIVVISCTSLFLLSYLQC